MKVSIDTAIAHPGERIAYAFTLPQQEFAEDPELQGVLAPVEIRGEYWYDGERLHWEGELTTRMRGVCTRCLDEFEREVRVPVYERFVREPEKDADALGYDGLTVDVRSLVRDTLLIEEPVQVLCREDCQGLCPHCGTNLNKGSCDCSDTGIDPRWAALAAWKQSSRNE